MSKRKVLVFDCDGTLVNSIPQGFHATCQVFKEAGKPPPTFEDFFVNFYPPASAYYRNRGVHLTDREIWEIYLRHADYHTVELFPDTAATLTTLAFRAEEFGIVHSSVLSANSSNVLQTLLKERGIRKFFHEVTGDVTDKAAELQRIVRAYDVEPKSVIFIGDFPCDMRDGDRAGVFTIGIKQCSPGFCIPDLGRLLRDAGADYCISSLEELIGVLGMIQ